MKAARLLNRNFVLLFQGQLVSQIGSSIYMIALIFWLKHATDSATLVGLLSMTATLPGVLLGPFGGTVADLFSRKLLIVVGDLINGVLIISIAAVMFLSPQSTDLIITLLFTEAVIGGAVMAVFRPAISAAIPDLVPATKIDAANGMYQASSQIAMLIGQSIGGLLFRILGAPLVMLIDGVTYLFSALSESFISIPQKLRERSTGFRPAMQQFKTDTIEGFQYVRSMRGLMVLFLVVAVASFFTAPFGVLLPFFVEDTLGATPDWFGYMIAGLALGSIIGSILAGVIRIKPANKGKFVVFSVAVQALCIGGFGYSSTPGIAALVLGLVGLVGGVTNVMIISVIQLSTASEIRGRVFGLLGTMSAGLAPISMGLAGVVADALDRNIPLIYAFCGLGVLLVLPVLILNREFHSMMALVAPEPELASHSELNPAGNAGKDPLRT